MKTNHLPLLLLIAASTLLPASYGADAPVVVAPDHSLAVKDYVAKGVPSPDSLWTPADYTTAAAALDSIMQTDVTQLPRFDSATSGALFKRFINDDNLAPWLDKSTPVDQRMVKLSQIGGISPLLMVYVKASTSAHNFDTELVEIASYMLRAEMDGAVIIKQFRAAHPELATNQQVQAGLDQAKGGFSQTLGGIVDMMLEFANTHPSEALRCAGHLKTIMPALLPELPAGDADKLTARLKSAADAETKPDVKAALASLAAIGAPAK